MSIPFKEIMERDKKETFDYHNFDSWSELDFNPEVINFLEIESENDSHGQMVRDVYKLVAPKNSNAYLGSMRYRVTGDEVVMCDILYYDSYISIEQFVKELDIHIIGASLSMKSDSLPEPLIDFLKTLPVIFVGSAGNDGSRGITGKFKHLGLMSGAIYLDNGEIRKETYSGVGEMMDFATLHSWAEGTSFSSPVLAGMVAWIIAKYGVMTQDKMKEVLISLSIDAGAEGHDPYFGHGVPILPKDGKIEMLEEHTTEIINDKLWTVRLLHNSENYVEADDIIEKGDLICRMGNSGTKYAHLHVDSVAGFVDRYSLIDIENGIYKPLPDKIRSLIVNELFRYKPIITGDYLEPGYKEEFNVPYNHWAIDCVPENRKITQNNYDVYWPLATPAIVINEGSYENGTKYVIIGVDEGVMEHWAKIYYENLKAKGIIIHEERFDDNITRGEMFALLDRVTDDYENKFLKMDKEIQELK